MFCDVFVFIFADAVITGKRDMFEPMITDLSCVIKEVISYKETAAKLIRVLESRYTAYMKMYGMLPTILYNLVRQIKTLLSQRSLAICDRYVGYMANQLTVCY